MKPFEFNTAPHNWITVIANDTIKIDQSPRTLEARLQYHKQTLTRVLSEKIISMIKLTHSEDPSFRSSKVTAYVMVALEPENHLLAGQMKLNEEYEKLQAIRESVIQRRRDPDGTDHTLGHNNGLNHATSVIDNAMTAVRGKLMDISNQLNKDFERGDERDYFLPSHDSKWRD